MHTNLCYSDRSLTVEYRIEFKTLCFVSNSLHGTAPEYLCFNFGRQATPAENLYVDVPRKKT